jgi:site-specific DNA recombinase
MIPKQYAAYIRVSTAKQGERGVSLQEQKDAIQRYAERNSLEVSKWFEERETAAKRGRPVFNEMLKLLRSGKACGVLIHKIDRSARNMKDWACVRRQLLFPVSDNYSSLSATITFFP